MSSLYAIDKHFESNIRMKSLKLDPWLKNQIMKQDKKFAKIKHAKKFVQDLNDRFWRHFENVKRLVKFWAEKVFHATNSSEQSLYVLDDITSTIWGLFSQKLFFEPQLIFNMDGKGKIHANRIQDLFVSSISEVIYSNISIRTQERTIPTTSDKYLHRHSSKPIGEEKQEHLRKKTPISFTD